MGEENVEKKGLSQEGQRILKQAGKKGRKLRVI